MLTIMSGLRDIYIKGDDSCFVEILIIYYIMLYIIYITLIMRLWDPNNLVTIIAELDMDSLLLFTPYFRRSLVL